jgi:hypothetical protein
MMQSPLTHTLFSLQIPERIPPLKLKPKPKLITKEKGVSVHLLQVSLYVDYQDIDHLMPLQSLLKHSL